MLDQDAIRSRLRARLKDMGLSLTGVWLKKHGIGQTTLRNFLDGMTQSLTVDTVAKLAEPLETSELWILFGDSEDAPAVSEDALREMAETAVEEIQLGMGIGEIRSAVASALHEQLALHLSGGEVRSFWGEKLARGKGAQSRSPTSEDVLAKSRTA